jgi:ketosteroid isomerase-like protein
MTMMTRKMLPALVAGAAAAAILSGCSQQAAKADPAQKAAIADQIRAMEAGWVKEYANRDLNRAVAHYADDAMLMPAGMDRMSGPKAIRGGLTELTKDPNFQLTFAADRVEVAASGDLAYSRGTYRMQMTDPKTKKPHVETGNYITTYKKQADGSWKAVDDMAAPGAPAPAAAAGTAV